MSAVSYYTAEGLKKLREELDYLKATPKLKGLINQAKFQLLPLLEKVY